jgi:hypothetical protein
LIFRVDIATGDIAIGDIEFDDIATAATAA